MRLVLDSSVALKWLLPESDSDRAVILPQRVRARPARIARLPECIIPISTKTATAFARANKRSSTAAEVLTPSATSAALLASLLDGCICTSPLRTATFAGADRHLRLPLPGALAATEEVTAFVSAGRKLYARFQMSPPVPPVIPAAWAAIMTAEHRSRARSLPRPRRLSGRGGRRSPALLTT